MKNICECVGCKSQGKYELQLLVGKKQKLKMCADHAPEWAKSKKGSPFYKVAKL